MLHSLAAFRKKDIERAGFGRSLRARLILLWLAVVAASGVAAYLMVEMFDVSVSAQIDRAQSVLDRGCARIVERYRFYSADWQGTQDLASDPLRRDLRTVVELALRDQAGVEGGVWQASAGTIAYAFPTYEGGGSKTDLPAAEFDRIKAINLSAVQESWAVDRRFNGRSQTLLLHACPLTGPIAGLTAWTMTRVFTAAWEGSYNFRAGLLLLFACVVGATALLTRIIVTWSKHIRGIERTLESGDVDLPPLALTGERELDRIITALNQAGDRLTSTRQQSDRLNRQVATAEKLASVGRMTAAFAHEIRNPISAMRLKAENALLDNAKSPPALNAIIEQIDRLDRLVKQLLTASHKEKPNRAVVRVEAFLEEIVSPYRDLAQSKQVIFRLYSDIDQAAIDPVLTKRAIENLVTNALRHSPKGGVIVLKARNADGRLLIEVQDKGQGVSPELRDVIFEPFVSGSPDGAGLGLAIACEAIKSQGGSIRLLPSDAGAAFQIQLPG